MSRFLKSFLTNAMKGTTKAIQEVTSPQQEEVSQGEEKDLGYFHRQNNLHQEFVEAPPQIENSNLSYNEQKDLWKIIFEYKYYMVLANTEEQAMKQKELIDSGEADNYGILSVGQYNELYNRRHLHYEDPEVFEDDVTLLNDDPRTYKPKIPVSTNHVLTPEDFKQIKKNIQD